MTNKDRILEKIRKCLALSRSSNEHEAAAAIRQAQKLMREHGVDDVDVAASAASESRTKAGALKTPANWESHLAYGIDNAFGVKHLFMQGSGEWMFIGVGAAAEIAGYSMEVMLRQVRRARKAYIDQKLRRCGPTSKTRRADLYCDAWVYSAIASVLPTEMSDEVVASISAYINKTYGGTRTLPVHNRNKGRKLTNRDHLDFNAGMQDGEGAYLHKGVGAAAGPALLE